MDGESIDIKQIRLQRLKEFFPELFAEGQLDWEKLKAAFGEDINFANERYVLNWAGKADSFKVLQQPTTATLKPVPEESVPIKPGAEKENMLYELMLKAGYELTSSIQHVMVQQAHHDTKADNVTLSLSKGNITKGATGVGYYSLIFTNLGSFCPRFC